MTRPGLEPGLPRGKPATNRLSYGAAKLHIFLRFLRLSQFSSLRLYRCRHNKFLIKLTLLTLNTNIRKTLVIFKKKRNIFLTHSCYRQNTSITRIDIISEHFYCFGAVVCINISCNISELELPAWAAIS
jgi:hypothetical protein